MNDIKPPGSSSELLDCLTDFLAESSELTNEEIKEDLRAKGVDPEKVVQRVKNLVESKLEERRLAWLKRARTERLAVLEKLKSVKSSTFSGTLEELKGKAIAILSGQFGQEASMHAQVYFRNPEDVTENDLRSLLDDLEALDLLTQPSDTDEEEEE